MLQDKSESMPISQGKGLSFSEKIYQDYTNYRDDSTEWRIECDKMRKFYFGHQRSSDLAAKYRKRGWSDVVVNKIRPLLRNRVSMLVASKPEGKVYGVGKEDISTAQALEEFMDFHFYNSDGQIQMEDASMSSQREGISYFVVYPDKMANYGMGELKFGVESYENVFCKKTARNWDLSDSTRIIHSKMVDMDDFILRHSNLNFTYDTLMPFSHHDDIPRWTGKEVHENEEAIGLPEQYSSGFDQYLLREFDVYDSIYEQKQIVMHKPTQTIEVLPDDYTITDDEHRLINDGVIWIGFVPVPRIKWTKMIGNGSRQKIIDSLILPIEYKPIIPIHDERTGNALSLGEVKFYYGLQEMLNQSTSLMILHAALGSLYRVVVDSGTMSPEEKDQFKQDFGIPGAVLNMQYDRERGKFPFEIIKPEPINQTFWTMIQHWGMELEYESQIQSMSWGDPTKAPETFAATMQIHEWAQNSLRIPLNHTEIAIQRVYECFLQWSRSFYGYRWFDVVRNGENADNFINSPIPRPSPTIPNQRSTHDIRELRARYRVRMGSTAPSQSLAYMNMYNQLSQKYPVFLKSLVQYLDIPADEKRELIQAVDIVGRQQSTIKEQEEFIKILQRTVQNLQARDVEHEKEHKIDRMLIQVEKEMAKLRADTDSIKKDFEVKNEKQLLQQEKKEIQNRKQATSKEESS